MLGEKNSPSWPFLFLSLFFFCNICYSVLLLLRFLWNLMAFRGPSWPFFFLSLEFCKICYSCYFGNISFSVFLGSRRNPCYFWDFFKPKILLNWLLFLLLLRYLQVIVSQNFQVYYFLCEKCEENLLTRSILDISQFFSFSVLFALPRHNI